MNLTARRGAATSHKTIRIDMRVAQAAHAIHVDDEQKVGREYGR